MRCERVRTLLQEYRRGRLDRPMSEAIRQHLAVCRHCAHRLEDEQKLQRLLHCTGFPPQPAREYFDRALAAARVRLGRTAPTAPKSCAGHETQRTVLFRRSHHLAQALQLAAAFSLGIVMTVLFYRNPFHPNNDKTLTVASRVGLVETGEKLSVAENEIHTQSKAKARVPEQPRDLVVPDSRFELKAPRVTIPQQAAAEKLMIGVATPSLSSQVPSASAPIPDLLGTESELKSTGNAQDKRFAAGVRASKAPESLSRNKQSEPYREFVVSQEAGKKSLSAMGRSTDLIKKSRPLRYTSGTAPSFLVSEAEALPPKLDVVKPQDELDEYLAAGDLLFLGKYEEAFTKLRTLGERQPPTPLRLRALLRAGEIALEYLADAHRTREVFTRCLAPPYVELLDAATRERIEQLLNDLP